jgi:hypothetical protein
MAAPIELPDIVGWEEVEFDPVAVKDTERMEGRRTETVRHGATWWKARYRTGFLDFRDFGRMDAFMMKVDGDGDLFRAYDVFRPRPMAHDNGQPLSGTKAGGGAFNGTATLSAITNSRTVTVSGLPAGFELRDGDYVEFRMSATKLSLHRVGADAVANGSGVVTLSIRYGLDTQNFTTAAIVNFEKPSCLMELDAGSYDGKKARRTRRPSFAATEMFPGS